MLGGAPRGGRARERERRVGTAGHSLLYWLVRVLVLSMSFETRGVFFSHFPHNCKNSGAKFRSQNSGARPLPRPEFAPEFFRLPRTPDNTRVCGGFSPIIPDFPRFLTETPAEPQPF